MVTTIVLYQDMYPFIGYFLEEWILIGAIIGQILLSLYRPFQQLSLVEQKKQFFSLLRWTQVILLLVILVASGLTLWSYNKQLNADLLFLHQGNFFFRQDALTRSINLVLTGMVFQYLHIVMSFFARTKSVRTYVSEFPILILLALLSLRLFLLTNDLIVMIIALELAAFCSVILIGMQSVSSVTISFPLEAAMKYFAINALSVTFLIGAIVGYYNMSLSINLIDIANYLVLYPYLYPFLANQILFIQILFFFAYFIKIGAAPFHHWVPDVYEGAETVITAFLVLIISPALNFKLFLLIHQLQIIGHLSLFLNMIAVCGLLSVLVGTFNAFYQTRIKRFIAYAGITHLGFMLVGLSCLTTLGAFSFLFYLFIYILTNLCFFTFLLFSQQYYRNIILIYFNQLKSVVQSAQLMFTSIFIIMLSFAGLPPFAGFFGKVFVLVSLLDNRNFFLALFLLFYILVGIYMYLRILKISLFETDQVNFYVALQNFGFYSLKSTQIKQRSLRWLPYYGSLAFFAIYWLLTGLSLFLFFLPLCGNGILNLSLLGNLIF